MKKTLILILILFVSFTAAYAAVVGTGALNVYGMIGAGEITFDVNQTLQSSTRIDLVNNTNVQPAGPGVEVGNWEFDAANQGSAVDYTVTYTYGTLSEGTTNIAYDILINDGTTSTTVPTGDTTTFSATAGNFNMVRTVLVRLTTAGATTASSAPASSNYNSTINLELTSP